MFAIANIIWGSHTANITPAAMKSMPMPSYKDMAVPLNTKLNKEVIGDPRAKIHEAVVTLTNFNPL